MGGKGELVSELYVLPVTTVACRPDFPVMAACLYPSSILLGFFLLLSEMYYCFLEAVGVGKWHLKKIIFLFKSHEAVMLTVAVSCWDGNVRLGNQSSVRWPVVSFSFSHCSLQLFYCSVMAIHILLFVL